MAIAHAQSTSDYVSTTRESAIASKACSEDLKAKHLRIIRKPATPVHVETTPVFVGIAG